MISAEPYTGKTMLMLAMALSLATGKPLFGKYNPHKNCRSLFLGQDAPSWDYVGQTSKLAYGYNLNPKSFGEWDLDLLLNKGQHITDQKFVNWVADWHSVTGFDVLFIDTLLKFHTADENSNTEMARVMDVLARIREQLDVTVIFSHHVGMPKETAVSANYRARGATAVAGAVDWHFQLQATGANNKVKIITPKGRGADDEIDPPDAFLIQSGKNGDGQKTVVLALDSDERENVFRDCVTNGMVSRANVVNQLQDNPNLSLTAVQAGDWFDYFVKHLIKEGKLKKAARGLYAMEG
jgi:hypothetical protein